jgi:hypothetical protein
MATSNRSLLWAGLALAAFFGAAMPRAVASDGGFGGVVRAVETTYHARRSYRWVGWLAGFTVKVARPEGVKSLKMALFEDQDFSPRANDAEFETGLRKALAGGWQPIVRVWSKRDAERTHIFARQRGQDIELFIVSLERTEAVVLQVKMSQARFSEMVDNPAGINASFRPGREEKKSARASEVTAQQTAALQQSDSLAP